MSERIFYKLEEAAEQVCVSVPTLRRAIQATDPSAFPPPLRAKRIGNEKKFEYRIFHSDLMAWANSLADA